MASNSRFQVAIWTLKLAFYSMGIISTAVFLKHAIPCFLGLAVSTLPSVWISLRTWLAIYIVVNFIILTISASSSFHPKLSEKNIQAEDRKMQEKHNDSEDPTPEAAALDPDEKSPEIFSGMRDSVVSSVEPLTESVRRRVRAAASSKSLGASNPKQHDTLDDTWKAITEGRGKRQLKKSSTWEVGPRVETGKEKSGLAGGGRDLRKWEAFRDAAAASASASWMGLRRDISWSKDELNRRVEAFIKKINNEIRLQRQQSYEKSLELVSQGSS